MGAWTEAPITPPFLLKREWPATGKPAIYISPLNNYPLTVSPDGEHQGPETFQTIELPGEPPRPKQYPQITGRLIT